MQPWASGARVGFSCGMEAMSAARNAIALGALLLRPLPSAAGIAPPDPSAGRSRTVLAALPADPQVIDRRVIAGSPSPGVAACPTI